MSRRPSHRNQIHVYIYIYIYIYPDEGDRGKKQNNSTVSGGELRRCRKKKKRKKKSIRSPFLKSLTYDFKTITAHSLTFISNTKQYRQNKEARLEKGEEKKKREKKNPKTNGGNVSMYITLHWNMRCKITVRRLEKKTQNRNVT